LNTTSAVFVVPPGGMYAAVHWRSTPNGEQLVPQTTMFAALVPYCHASDFQTSAWSGAAAWLPASLHS
jgi:hypothetical protein